MNTIYLLESKARPDILIDATIAQRLNATNTKPSLLKPLLKGAKA
jgi:hypothetical protein